MKYFNCCRLLFFIVSTITFGFVQSFLVLIFCHYIIFQLNKMSGFVKLTEYAKEAVSKYGDEISYESEHNISYEEQGSIKLLNSVYKCNEKNRKKL